MINFISVAAMELVVALFSVNRKHGFHDDAIVYSSIGSTQYEPKLHSVNWGTLPFINTNQWYHQVISINLYKLKLKLQVQTEISAESTNWN